MIVKSSDPKLKSAQEVFDFVCRHLLNQKNKCQDEFGFCLLRHDGMACAIGCLIPNEKYSTELETMTNRPINLPLHIENNEHEELLVSLRIVHDRFDPNKWPERLKIISIKYKLNMPI